MKKTECQQWIAQHETAIRSLFPDARRVVRRDNDLTVLVPTVHEAKASWHTQRDRAETARAKAAVRRMFPELHRVTVQYDGSADPAPVGNFRRLPQGWVLA